MITAKDIRNQIEKITVELISTGLCDDQNFPSLTQLVGNIEEVGITNAENSIFLKSIPYNEMYRALINKRTFNIKMIDGALISMLYRFKNKELIAHRLSFFPSPDLEIFQNEPELYLEDDLYMDVLDKRVVTVPLRFDFDCDTATFKPIEHPISHLTLGQYENCRIPVAAAITPYQFIKFITTNFYHTAHEKYCNKLTICKDCFDVTIFDEEKELLHMHTPIYRS